ncbi:T9SS type A sorting domain-containing protein [Flavisolibacter tropicus]|uniref:Secretion system C-terminal sorting domain-containing protein n=1 Tax=Flavisolibacter tropicus TaxID=1492898 RepID=A0A172TYL6_9BACT|nr:T9SS type A sorting domain-containing protein [Flavisolibacter tropicus]ANE52058.1 hypothetical protein SY85_17720 [Flavisolibacter tropicus]
MRRTLPFSILSSLLLFTTISLYAQNDRFAYVVTDLNDKGSGWNALRRLDLKTGQYSDLLFNGTDEKAVVYDATTHKVVAPKADARFGNMLNAPFSTGVAAAAYDRKHNRLYFTPMFIDQLRYIDLRTMKVYYVTDQAFTQAGNMHNDEGKCITRMVIAPDGYGYAISNNGETFIRFSTNGKKSQIQQLGKLVDDASNNGISVHNRCSSFGGDMIADDKGSLYILSARNYVFKVDINTKVAKLMGNIKGLPAQFTTNGAVVDGDGNLLVSSAIDGSGYYVVNPKSWEASVYQTPIVFRSSDLANSNYLSTSGNRTTIESIARVESKYANQIQVYPNPITSNQFNLQFNRIPAGEYTLQLTDVMGRQVMQKRLLTADEYVNQSISISSLKAHGVYLVRVLNKENEKVYEQKVMIQ